MPEETLIMIRQEVENAFKNQLNGQFVGLKKDVADIKTHLTSQDKVLEQVSILLEERKFRYQVWDFCKKIIKGFITIGSIGGAYLILKKILQL